MKRKKNEKIAISSYKISRQTIKMSIYGTPLLKTPRYIHTHFTHYHFICESNWDCVLLFHLISICETFVCVCVCVYAMPSSIDYVLFMYIYLIQIYVFSCLLVTILPGFIIQQTERYMTQLKHIYRIRLDEILVEMWGSKIILSSIKI